MTDTSTRRKTSDYTFTVTVPGGSGEYLTNLIGRLGNAILGSGLILSGSHISPSHGAATVTVRLPSDDQQARDISAILLRAAEHPSAIIGCTTGLGIHKRIVPVQ